MTIHFDGFEMLFVLTKRFCSYFCAKGIVTLIASNLLEANIWCAVIAWIFPECGLQGLMKKGKMAAS